MGDTFFEYFRRLWLSALPSQLVKGILVAACFEILVFIINRRISKALAPALARDADADAAQRAQRRRVVLGVPRMIVRTVLYALALLVILRIFRFRNEADLYPVALALIVVIAVAARNALRDAVAGYFIQYDYLFAVGDEITVGEYSGMVSEIGLRTTRLRTRDSQEIVVNNSEIRALINRTGLRRRDS